MTVLLAWSMVIGLAYIWTLIFLELVDEFRPRNGMIW